MWQVYNYSSLHEARWKTVQNKYFNICLHKVFVDCVSFIHLIHIILIFCILYIKSCINRIMWTDTLLWNCKKCLPVFTSYYLQYTCALYVCTGGTVLTVSGYGFSNYTAVIIGSQPCNIIEVELFQLRCIVPAVSKEFYFCIYSIIIQYVMQTKIK